MARELFLLFPVENQNLNKREKRKKRTLPTCAVISYCLHPPASNSGISKRKIQWFDKIAGTLKCILMNGFLFFIWFPLPIDEDSEFWSKIVEVRKLSHNSVFPVHLGGRGGQHLVKFIWSLYIKTWTVCSSLEKHQSQSKIHIPGL